jgi:hypothetical protein
MEGARLDGTVTPDGSKASFETEDGLQQNGLARAAGASIDEELAGTVEVQEGGEGDFRTATITVKGGVLRLKWKTPPMAIASAISMAKISDFPLTNLRVEKVSNERDGRPYCLKISLLVPADGVRKYVFDADTLDGLSTWMMGLEDRITARLDAKLAQEINQTADGENYPNMTFIPLKTVEPTVPAGEFALFLLLLTIFMFNLSTQDFENDFLTTDSLKGMTGWVQFNKISTVEDYIDWWPVLLMSLKRWTATREGWLDQSIDLLADEQISRKCDLLQGCTDVAKEDINQGAVLLGHPFITQTRKLRFGTTYPPPFNASGSQQCEWELYLAGGEEPSNGTASATSDLSCYGSVRTSPDSQLEYYVPQMQGVLNGTYAWSPANWIGATTTELSHQFVLYFPSARKFAVVRIYVNIDQAGRVGQQSLQGNYPSFDVYEPFMWESDPRYVALELLFYVFVAKLFIDELFEVWECICFTEMLLPLQVLTASLDLQLHEIMYFHERASQVYDPRDPKTEKAFKFPDLEDLETHMNGRVKECENVVESLEGHLTELKIKMARSRGKQITKGDHEVYRKEMVELQLKLTLAAERVRKEENVAEVAAMMQLAVMWANNWSFDFPDAYLAQLGDDKAIGEDGLQAFCDVNWIAVSRAYLVWCVDTGHSHEIEDDGGMMDVMTQLTFKVTHPFAGNQKSELEKAQYTAQFKHFDKLAPLLDYLDMLHDVLFLHTQLVTARQIKHWQGPRGAEMGSTVTKAFQRVIADYNGTGKRLKEEMGVFPDEIADGFSEPDAMKAETIKIKAKALIREVQTGVETAGMLGLFFPGSVMWELQRKGAMSSKHIKSRAFKDSLGTFGLSSGSIVSDSSMKIYVRQAVVLEEDDDDESNETINPVGDDNTNNLHASTPLSPRGSSRGVYETGTPGWRTWIPRGAEQLINYDGQFVVPHDKLHQWMSGTIFFPFWLWFKSGVTIYMGDVWNTLEFLSSLSFMYSFYSKVRMLQMADALDTQREIVESGEEDDLILLEEFSFLSMWYMKCLALNAMLMWCKLFKYIGVIPQMGVLLTVLGQAGPSVMIFTIVAMVPCIGLSLSYHVVFGAVVKNYSSPYLALNSVMRMAVGDFDFDEIYGEHPMMSLLLFWVSSLLIVMVLINIFIAIIMSAYDTVLSHNPEAADASSFVSMVMMQLTRILKAATGGGADKDDEDQTEIHVLQNTMDRIDDEAYWDIFEGYFDMPSSDEEEEEEDEDGDELGGGEAIVEGGGGGEGAAPSSVELRSLAQDVASIKQSQAEQAKQMSDVVAQLSELKEMLSAALN